MLTVRLPQALEQEIGRLAEAERKTKSQLVKEALLSYLESKKKTHSPYALGADLFGQFESASGDLSQTYRDRLRERLGKKHAH